MQVYRIGVSKFIKDLTGTGARLFGGRWNRKGLSVLYTVEHRSLAALEILVHMNKHELPDDLKIITLNIPENSIKQISLKEFNKFNKIQNRNKLRSIGSDWITKNKTLCLKVPSIIIKEEFNILLNPNHQWFQQVKINKVDDFMFDKRLLK